jgi:hypothetical protein
MQGCASQWNSSQVRLFGDTLGNIGSIILTTLRFWSLLQHHTPPARRALEPAEALLSLLEQGPGGGHGLKRRRMQEGAAEKSRADQDYFAI